MTSKKSKIILQILIIISLIILFSGISYAASLNLPDITFYKGMVQDPGIPNNSETPFSSNLASLFVGIVLNIRYVILAVVILLSMFAGFELITSQGNEEKWTNAKRMITFSIVGLALIGLAGEIVRIFASGNCAELGMLPSGNTTGCVQGGFLKNPQAILQRSTLFNQTVKYLIVFIKYIIGSIAVVVLMRTAYRMATNQADEELEKDKKNVIATIIGLILIVMADPIINKVFFTVDQTKYPTIGGVEVGINYAQGVKEIIGITNFLVSIFTPIAILVIVAGGVMYITSAGNTETQEKAKRMITLAIIAFIIIYGAFAIVSTFVNGSFSKENNQVINPAEQIENPQNIVSTPQIQ